MDGLLKNIRAFDDSTGDPDDGIKQPTIHALCFLSQITKIVMNFKPHWAAGDCVRDSRTVLPASSHFYAD